MVLTLVIVTDEGSAYDALKSANDASREHPSRILAVIRREGRSPQARAAPDWTPRSWSARMPGPGRP